MWLHSSVGRASHRCSGGHGFESRWSSDIFQASSFQLVKLENLLRWSLFTFNLTNVLPTGLTSREILDRFSYASTIVVLSTNYLMAKASIGWVYDEYFIEWFDFLPNWTTRKPIFLLEGLEQYFMDNEHQNYLYITVFHYHSDSDLSCEGE